MSTTITRLYRTTQQATDSANALKKAGFNEINTVHAGGEGDATIAAIRKGGVSLSHAKVYADFIARGAALVTVNAPALNAVRANRILSRFDPIESPVSEPDVYHRTDAVYMTLMSSDSTPSTKLLDSDSYFFGFLGSQVIHDAKPWSSVDINAKPFSKVDINAKPWFGGIIRER